MTLKSPGVEVKVYDNSDFASAFASTAFGMLVKSNKGPLDVTPVTSSEQFIKLYGQPDIDVSESHFHAVKLLENGGRLLYCKRVQNSSNYAGCIFYQDRKVNPTKISSVDFPYGTTGSYETDGFKVILLNLNESLVEQNTISLEMTDSSQKQLTVTQSYVDSCRDTLLSFADKIKQEIKNTYNTDVGTYISTSDEGVNQLEIYTYRCDEVTRKPDVLKCRVLQFAAFTAVSLTLTVFDGSENKTFTLTSMSNVLIQLLQDYKNQIEQNYSNLLTAEIDSSTNTIIFTAVSKAPGIFVNHEVSAMTAEFTEEIDDTKIGFSFNVPQLSEAVEVYASYASVEDVLLDLSTQLTENYGKYVSTLLNTDERTISLIARIPQEDYITNIKITGLDGDLVQEQKGIGDNSHKQVIIVAPVSSNVSYISYTKTDAAGTVSQQEIVQDTELFNVFAENPGSWGNEIGVSISVDSNDIGTKEIYGLTFHNLIAGVQLQGAFSIVQLDEDDVEISKTKKTFTLTPIQYKTSDKQFLTDIQTEFTRFIQDNFGIYEGISLDFVNNKMTIQSPKSGWVFNFNDLFIYDPTGQVTPSIDIQKEMNNVCGKGTFSLNIFSNNDLTSVLESYNGSLYEILDSSNNQLNISELVNTSNPSTYIRVKQFDTSMDSGLEVIESTKIKLLTGGSNGNAVTAGDYNIAMQDFNSEDYDIFQLIDDGFNDITVKQNLASLADTIDAVAILSFPKNKVSTMSQMIDYRNNGLGINNCSAAIFGPSLKVYDNYTGKQIEVTVGGWVADRMAYTEENYGRHQAAAGQRGALTGLLGLNKNYKKSEYDELYPNQINLIRNVNSAYQIDGIKTLQRKETALQNIPAVLMKNTIKKNAKKILQGFVFELNLPDTRNRVWNACNDYMNNLKVNSMIAAYRIVCDDTNNSNADLDAGRLNVLMQFVPVGIIEYITVTLTIEKNGTISTN